MKSPFSKPFQDAGGFLLTNLVTVIEHTPPKINNKNKYWYVWFRAKHPITGKWKLFTHKKGINKDTNIKERMRKANALKDAIAYALSNNLYNPFQDESFTERKKIITALEDILEIKKATLRGRSVVHYKDVLKIFGEWLKKNKMDHLYPDQFTNHYAILYTDHLLRDRKYSGKTHNIHVGTLKTFFNAMVRRSVISSNPFASIAKMQESEGSNVPYTQEEKEKVVEYLKAHSKRLYYAVHFVYFCFIRRTELIQLKVKDVDLVNHVINIRSYTSKTKRSRSITIPKAFDPILQEMELEQFDPECYVFGHKFQTCARKIVKPESLTYAMTRINKKLGITGKSFYTFKHTGMVALYKATHDPYLCMKQAGHSDLKMTQKYLRSLGLTVDENIRAADFTF